MARLEDARFLTGKGTYVSNTSPVDGLQGYVLRSPHGHAHIQRIDTAAAKAMPGVAAVLTGDDLTADDLGDLPCVAVVNTVEPIIVPPRPALAKGTVRHVGDPVAFIVAETIEQAIDAAEAIEVEYDSLPCVTEGRQAVEKGAPQIWPQAPGNSAFLYRRGDAEAVQRAMAAAATVVECDLVNNRVVVAPMEPRAAIGVYDAGKDLLHLTLTGQAVHGIRKQLADSVFRVSVDRMRLTVPDVGGGFGVKNFVYPEWALVLWAAKRLGRPIRWVSERVEDFVSSTHGRDNYTIGKLALDASGRFLGLSVNTVANMGAYLSSNAPGSPTMAAGSAMGGVYNIPAVSMEVRGAFTNTTPIDAYRGAGKPEANFVIERLVDLAASKLGIDPVELRRRNIISSFPHVTAMGMNIEGGRFVANLDEAVLAADRAGFERRRQQSADKGKLRGQGFACFLETARGAPGEVARIAFNASGEASLAVGTQSNGQGHESTYPQILSEIFGLPLSSFQFQQGDTNLLPSGNGHGGARSMHMGGTALVIAAEKVLEKGRRIAAHLLQAPLDKVSFADAQFNVRGTERSISLVKLAEASLDRANLPEGLTPGLEALGANTSDLYTFPNGCHVAEVEIDPETGSVVLERYTLVDDFGRLLNPLLTLGQVHGGVVQGIGQAMLEHVVFDADSGQLLTSSLTDYALPRAQDLPSFSGGLNEAAPTPSNPLGVKGSGQAGCIAAPQTIMNAILNALAPLGITHLDMPATPQRVWNAVQARRALQ